MSAKFEVVFRDAKIDPTEKYRYWLLRVLKPLEPGVILGGRAVFIMLNPSTADGKVDDATIRRCMGFAYKWRCMELVVVNLFALRSTDPAALYKDADPIGPENDYWIMDKAVGWSQVVAAWGAHGKHLQRAHKVRQMLQEEDQRLVHLGLTKDGHPKHPLYLPENTELMEMAAV